MHRGAPLVLVVSVVLHLAAMRSSHAFGPYPAPFPIGVSGLFAGHSFFAPVAGDFSTIALANGYVDHSADIVISGAQSGSPRRLWENATKRNEIIGHLDDRDIDLFGLTVYSEEDSSFEDYARWFDEALKHNPDTQFLVGHPQTPQGAVTPSVLYDTLTEELGAQTFQIVKQLRAAYPNNPVHFIHYGKVATEMKHRYDAGELPDVLSLLPDEELMIGPSDAMFTDIDPGHGGPMIKELGALSWMSLLYGADVASLDYTEYQSDVEGIIADVTAFNEQFRATVVGDYNADGTVDAADYTRWRDALGQEGVGLPADGNGDSQVTAADYALWRENLGATVQPPPLSASVPEPSSMVVAVLLIAVSCARRV
ncbi:MAG: dockerin type I domain-containing protein [Planctomycetota bacterium]